MAVLENELVEVCTMVPKNIKIVTRPSCVYCSFKGRLSEMPINAYMKIWHTRDRFSTFLKLTRKLQSTRSPKLPNGFWWFLVQNKAGVFLVSLLCSVSYFCLVEKDKNFKRSLELVFHRSFCKQFGVRHQYTSADRSRWSKYHGIIGNNKYNLKDQFPRKLTD